MTETKTCKKCKKEFKTSNPKEKYCERCKNKMAKDAKNGGTVLASIAGVIITIVTLGKIRK